jgi:hypothetical protein
MKKINVERGARELAAARIRSMPHAELIALLSSVEPEENVGIWVRADAILVSLADVKKFARKGAAK